MSSQSELKWLIAELNDMYKTGRLARCQTPVTDQKFWTGNRMDQLGTINDTGSAVSNISKDYSYWIAIKTIDINHLDLGGISAADCMQTDEVNSSLEKWNFCFFSLNSFTIDFKICLYARCLIHHIVHMIFFDYTLLQTLRK